MGENTDRNPLILLMDGNGQRRSSMSRLLSRTGYRVAEAPTVREGVRRARELAPNLILLEANLSDLAGVEVCQHIQAQLVPANPSVFLISDLETSLDDQSEGLEPGADDHIVWPISDHELLARVRKKEYLFTIKCL